MAGALILAGCSPSPPAAPATQETTAPAAPLPTDFLGLKLGEPHGLKRCDVELPIDAMWPCLDHFGRASLDPRQVPTGVDSSLSLTVDDQQSLVAIIATVERGHDGRITGNLVTKYGPAHLTDGHGYLQWSDAATVVTYLPAKIATDGAIFVETSEYRRKRLTAHKEAQERPL